MLSNHNYGETQTKKEREIGSGEVEGSFELIPLSMWGTETEFRRWRKPKREWLKGVGGKIRSVCEGRKGRHLFSRETEQIYVSSKKEEHLLDSELKMKEKKL